MKIKEINMGIVHYLTTDEEGYNQYTRHSSGYWTITMGESEEPCYNYEELEQLFQQWLNGPKKEESPLKESQTFYDQADHIISITRGIVEGIDNIQIFKNKYNDR